MIELNGWNTLVYGVHVDERLIDYEALFDYLATSDLPEDVAGQVQLWNVEGFHDSIAEYHSCYNGADGVPALIADLIDHSEIGCFGGDRCTQVDNGLEPGDYVIGLSAQLLFPWEVPMHMQDEIDMTWSSLSTEDVEDLICDVLGRIYPEGQLAFDTYYMGFVEAV